MPWSLLDILLALPVFALVLFRITGLMLTAPIYGSRVMPMQLRVAVAVVLATIAFPLVSRQAPNELSLSAALVGGIGEMMIGASIGLGLTLLLLGAEVAGLIVGRQAGVALANVYDPVQNQDVSVVGQVYSITMIVLFLLVGGHRAAIAALLDTFTVIPLLSFGADDTVLVLLVEMLAAAFMLGIRLAGPVLIALFMLGTSLGFLSRTMPQLNILTVGFPLRLLVGMAIAGIALSACEGVLLDAIWDGVVMIRETFGLDPAHTRLVT